METKITGNKQFLHNNKGYVKCIRQINAIADKLLEENRKHNIGKVILFRALRTSIPLNINENELPKDENAEAFWSANIMKFILNNTNIDYKFFLNRVCMIPAPTKSEIETLKEIINEIREVFEIDGDYVVPKKIYVYYESK